MECSCAFSWRKQSKADEFRFRWVSCQLDTLQKCHNIPALRQALVSLPKTLDETYARMLDSISEELIDYAIVMLRWLVYATRPLKLKELGELIAVNLDSDPRFDLDARFLDLKDLLNICPGLIAGLLPDNEAWLGESIIRLAHYSVKEFLTSERIGNLKVRRFSLSDGISHELIASECLVYLLLFQDFSRPMFDLDWQISMRPISGTQQVTKLLQDYPLLEYAAYNWPVHATLSGGRSERINCLGLDLLCRDKAAYKMWYFFLSTFETNEIRGLPSPLYMMAEFGVTWLVEQLMKEGSDVNEMNSIGTPLWAASKEGHLGVMKLLIDCGAKPDLHPSDRWPPLHEAAGCNKIQAADLLIKSGANLRHTALGSVLHTACARTKISIDLVRLLASKEIDIDAIGGKYGTALQAACAFHGNQEVIRLLLARADCRLCVKNSKYYTALQAVCAESHDQVAVVEMLIQHGAFPDRRGGKYGSALEAACWRNNHNIAKYLLRKHIDICHAEGTKAATERLRKVANRMLSIAVTKRCVDLASIVLNDGIDYEFGTQLSQNLLLRSIQQEDQSFTELFLGCGAKIQDRERRALRDKCSGLEQISPSMLRVNSLEFLRWIQLHYGDETGISPEHADILETRLFMDSL